MSFFKKHRDIAVYLLLGGLTTAVNYGIYYPLYNIFNCSASVSNILAWVVAVAFAFVTNKPFAFHSYDWSAKTVFLELWKFVGCRAFSGLVETAVIFVTVDWLQWDGNWMKIVTAVFVVILNYVASRFLVFSTKGK